MYKNRIKLQREIEVIVLDEIDWNWSTGWGRLELETGWCRLELEHYKRQDGTGALDWADWNCSTGWGGMELETSQLELEHWMK